MPADALEKAVTHRKMERLARVAQADQERAVRRLLDGLKDRLVIADAGLTVHTPGKLSPGCRACKEGYWLCLYVGYSCNLSCPYCPQENAGKTDAAGRFRDLRIDEVKRRVDRYGGTLIRGIGYSGGEPFKYLDTVCDFARHVRRRHPRVYQWIYTNGLLAKEDHFKKLADCGVEEIRFHLLASHFSAAAMRRVAAARRYFSRLAVEVPSLPETYRHLIEKKAIRRLEEYGVDQLNLAELAVTPANVDALPPLPSYRYVSASFSALSPVVSRLLTCRIMAYAIRNRVRIVVNDCSNDAKRLQMSKRAMNPVISGLSAAGKRITG